MMAICMTREKVAQPLQEARRLLDSVGWAFILPQILAVLGLLFTTAGVGNSIAWLTEHYLAVDSRFVAVAVYTIGMALLTMVMGNGVWPPSRLSRRGLVFRFWCFSTAVIRR